MGERLAYIDIARGLLIIMVVCGHFELMCRLCFGISDPVVTFFDRCQNIWIVFLMPAFFYITGFCTNFNKSFRSFVQSGIKTILLPAYILQVIFQLSDYVFKDASLIWILKTLIKNTILHCTGEWFIPSLFLARILLWFITKSDFKALKYIYVFCLFAVGLILYNGDFHIPNVWYFKHSFMVTPFVLFGYEMKGVSLDKRIESISIITYIIIISLLLILNFHIPRITSRVILPYDECVLFLILSVLGIIAIICVSKSIKNHKSLEWIGKNTLVIYLLHFQFYQIYIRIVNSFFNLSIIGTIGIIFSVVIITFISSCFVAWLLNTKYLRFILGKY